MNKKSSFFIIHHQIAYNLIVMELMFNNSVTENHPISQEEKENMMLGIEKKFSSFFISTPHLMEYKSISNGLLLPLGVIVIALVLSSVSIYLSNIIINRTYTVQEILSSNVSSESEWAILKTFKENVELKIRKKDREIEAHKEKIAEYDRKLSDLRNLIDLKKRAESQFSEERKKLSLSGLTSDAIDSKMVSMEENIILTLNQEMIELYNLSVEDLNNRIDQILDDKRESEIKMEATLLEKEILEGEQNDIQESMGSRDITPLNTDEELHQLNDTERRIEHNDSFSFLIQSKYMEVLNDIESGNFQSGLLKLSDIEDFLNNQNNSDSNTDKNMIDFYLTIIDPLENLINNEMTVKKEDIQSSGQNDQLLQELNSLTQILVESYEHGNYESAESDLRNKIKSIQEISNAFQILQKIDYEIYLDETDSTMEIGIVPDSSDDSVNVEEYPILSGVIMEIRFNRVSIRSSNSGELNTGEEFTVISSKDEETVLARGIITALENDTVIGELQTLYDFSIKPEPDDMVLFQKNHKGNK